MAPAPALHERMLAHHERLWCERGGGYRVLAPLPLPFVPSGVPLNGPSGERDSGGRLSRDLGGTPR